MSLAMNRKRDIAHSVLLVLEEIERTTTPEGTHSRLYTAIQVCQETLAFYTFNSLAGRERLLMRIQDLRDVESIAALQGLIPVGSVMQRGISIALHIGGAALADADPKPRHVLREARELIEEVLA
jgi:hypothetical protein